MHCSLLVTLYGCRAGMMSAQVMAAAVTVLVARTRRLEVTRPRSMLLLLLLCWRGRCPGGTVVTSGGVAQD